MAHTQAINSLSPKHISSKTLRRAIQLTNRRVRVYLTSTRSRHATSGLPVASSTHPWDFNWCTVGATTPPYLRPNGDLGASGAVPASVPRRCPARRVRRASRRYSSQSAAKDTGLQHNASQRPPASRRRPLRPGDHLRVQAGRRSAARHANAAHGEPLNPRHRYVAQARRGRCGRRVDLWRGVGPG